MKNKLKRILSLLIAVLLITAMLPISIFAQEQDYSENTSLNNIPYMIQAAIDSGDVYDLSQLSKLGNFPPISENAVYIAFILEDYTPVGITSYEITDETEDFQIQASELIIPDGYILTDTAQSHEIEIEIAEGGSKSFSPSFIAFNVKPVLPDPLPNLKISYQDNGTTVFVENKILDDFEIKTIEANLILLERLGYKIGNSSELNTDYQDIFRLIFGDIEQQTSFRVSLNDRIPLIPSDFLIWYNFCKLDIPFALSGNTFNIEVDKERDVDLNVDIIFQTADNKQVGEITHMEMNPLVDYLTVNKDNLPSLPVGYKLADPEESHTAFWEKVDGIWEINPKTLIFTVVSNQIEPTPQIITRTPIVLSDVSLLNTPLTSDNSDYIILYALLTCTCAGFVILKCIRKRKST